MKCLIISLLVYLLAVSQTHGGQCDLSKAAKKDKMFPNIEAEGQLSYQIAVECTSFDKSRTDYYMEYYDIEDREGRLDSHEGGKHAKFIYKTESWEAFEINDIARTCKSGNTTEILEFRKDDRSEWVYKVDGNDTFFTYGPSAMFKRAYAAWNLASTQKGYMGEGDKVRGMPTEHWRICESDDVYVDYFFTTKNHEDAYGFKKLKNIPLRVVFGGTKAGKPLKTQYEIISFKPFVSEAGDPFQVPLGYGCVRSSLLTDKPEIPSLANKNFMFLAEVIYSMEDEEENPWHYYSNIMMAVDVSNEQIAYSFSKWDTSKSNDGKEPDVKSPELVVYDMKHKYSYRTNLDTQTCNISRLPGYVPRYELPENGGSIDLTDPEVLFTNNELYFLTEGKERGLDVNVFEAIMQEYPLGDRVVPKAIISHTYFKTDNFRTDEFRLSQIQMRFIDDEEEETGENITINFFLFKTQIPNIQAVFDITNCFKNDEDFIWVTLGYPIDQNNIDIVKDEVPAIKAQVLESILLYSELTPSRIPIINVDFREKMYATLLVLSKPPVTLDYMEPEENMVVSGTEGESIQTFYSCATKCLERETSCWAFSICGSVCNYATSSQATVIKAEGKGCKLYRRYNNETYVPSKEMMVDSIRSQVKAGQVKVILGGGSDTEIILVAASTEVAGGIDNSLIFDQMGLATNPRLRPLKIGAKLKKGETVKNLGRLRYDECQAVCLDFKDCETVSYCVTKSQCIISTKYGDEIDAATEIEVDNMCNLLTRKYADHFQSSPGIMLSRTAKKVIKADTYEDCARACLKEKEFKCLSFDNCPDQGNQGCRLHEVHFLSDSDREKEQVKDSNCGHSYRKYSTEFRKTPNHRLVGKLLPPLTNITLEECAHSCMEYGKGTCFGYDFCQDKTLYSTSCFLFDKDPLTFKSSDSSICNNYVRSEAQFAPRPYSTSYAGGIGFLCFLVGGIIGAAVVFAIAYFRVNKG